MAMMARYPVLAFRHFVFLCALWTWSALPASVQAGFELTLDSASVRAIGDHYAIDVLLTSIHDPDEVNPVLDINGIVSTVKSPNLGLVFLKIAPVANMSLFDEADSWPDDDLTPSSGNPEETWTSYVFVDSGTITPPEGTSIAFQLEFSVPQDGPYAIQFVNISAEENTQYSYPGNDVYEFGDFDALNSSNFVVSTPEPSSLALLTLAVGGLSVWRGRAMRCATDANKE